jgi:anti-sigma B factor antagonist
VSFELRAVPGPPGADGIPAVEVRGDIDATNAAGLRAALEEHASPGLIVDLSHAAYFDSAGFAMIDDLLSRITAAIVIAPGSVLRTAASLMNLPFHDTVDDARASLLPG